MYLTNNFRLREFTRSAVADSHNIVNNVKNNTILHSIIQLCENVLQPLRDKLGPVHILSGYRCEALNKMVGGADNSQHTKGEAADIYVTGMNPEDLFQYIISNFEFDQCILYFNDTCATFVHVSWSINNRHQHFSRFTR